MRMEAIQVKNHSSVNHWRELSSKPEYFLLKINKILKPKVEKDVLHQNCWTSCGTQNYCQH